jgi:hypothetical protein
VSHNREQQVVPDDAVIVDSSPWPPTTATA